MAAGRLAMRRSAAMTGARDQGEPADDVTRARAQAAQMLASDTSAHALGIEIGEVGPGRATARMTVRADMLNGHGTCHGGYVFLLADSAFAFACNTHGEAAVASGCDIDFVRPARDGEALVATAVERVRFGRSGLCDVTVRGAAGDVVAEMRGRSRALGPRRT